LFLSARIRILSCSWAFCTPVQGGVLPTSFSLHSDYQRPVASTRRSRSSTWLVTSANTKKNQIFHVVATSAHTAGGDVWKVKHAFTKPAMEFICKLSHASKNPLPEIALRACTLGHGQLVPERSSAIRTPGFVRLPHLSEYVAFGLNLELSIVVWALLPREWYVHLARVAYSAPWRYTQAN
jgi:hypothetical protein